MFEVLAVVYFVALACVAIFCNNAEIGTTTMILRNIPDKFANMLPSMDEPVKTESPWRYTDGYVVELDLI